MTILPLRSTSASGRNRPVGDGQLSAAVVSMLPRRLSSFGNGDNSQNYVSGNEVIFKYSRPDIAFFLLPSLDDHVDAIIDIISGAVVRKVRWKVVILWRFSIETKFGLGKQCDKRFK